MRSKNSNGRVEYWMLYRNITATSLLADGAAFFRPTIFVGMAQALLGWRRR
jgi:hypothetical protein